MLTCSVKTFPAVKAQNGLVVVNGVFAMRANIFAHNNILLQLRAGCQEKSPEGKIIWYNINMNSQQILKNKKQIIVVGKQLAESRLVCAVSGNLSVRLDSGNILITATGTGLGNLKYSDILKVSLAKAFTAGAKKQPSSELPIHRLIYRSFPCRAVIHCHPPLANAYFAVYPELKVLTFETQFYLPDIPVVKQKGINVTCLEAVIRALKNSRIVVVKNHGVFSIADNFQQALKPILILEEAVKVAAVARLFKKKSLDKIDREIKRIICKGARLKKA